MTSLAPKGLGVYCRMLTEKTHGTPTQFAKKLKDNGFSYAAFMACWQDKSGPGRTFAQRAGASDATLAKYIDACSKAGIDVWLWGFPWLGHEKRYMDTLAVTVKKFPQVKGLIHDPEVSYRDKNAKKAPRESRGQGEAVTDAPEGDASRTVQCATQLMLLDEELVRDLKLQPSGVTSYGMATWHPLPWDTFAAKGRVWGSPQLYTVTAAQVDAGLASWNSHGFAGIVPSVPAYGDNSGAALDAHLAKFVDGGNEPTIDGFLVWSFQQVGGVEWRTFAKWAEMLKKKAC